MESSKPWAHRGKGSSEGAHRGKGKEARQKRVPGKVDDVLEVALEELLPEDLHLQAARKKVKGVDGLLPSLTDYLFLGKTLDDVSSVTGEEVSCPGPPTTGSDWNQRRTAQTFSKCLQG